MDISCCYCLDSVSWLRTGPVTIILECHCYYTLRVELNELLYSTYIRTTKRPTFKRLVLNQVIIMHLLQGHKVLLFSRFNSLIYRSAYMPHHFILMLSMHFGYSCTDYYARTTRGGLNVQLHKSYVWILLLLYITAMDIRCYHWLSTLN